MNSQVGFRQTRQTLFTASFIASGRPR